MANSLTLPMEVSVKGLKELQTENRRLMTVVSVQPGGGMRSSVALAILQLHRYAVVVVHVKSGRLKNSIFMEIENQGNTIIGHVATNVVYAIHEEDRGGDHAFFARTVREEGPHVNSIFDMAVRRGGRT